VALHFLADEATGAQPGDDVVLAGAEAHHAASVRRLRTGETVTVGDGRGVWLEGAATTVSAREVVVRVAVRTEVPAASPRLTLVQALAKGDRDELAVQAATELGVDRIIPWQAERSVSRWDGKVDRALTRWRTIVREAAKQAHRAWLPEVTEPLTTAGLTRLVPGERVLLLEPSASSPLTGLDLRADTRDIVLVVGPEGGISPAELTALSEAGAEAARLGVTVLRTSTAGAAGLAVVNVALGRW
jgi:16S rRNA (uracil1498-N3)-methyltransferase